MLAPYSGLHVVALEHKRLTDRTLAALEAVRIPAGPARTPSGEFQARVGRPFDDVAIIEKCNSVTVVGTISMETDERFARDCLLRTWLDLAPGLSAHLSSIEYFAGRRAVEYLGELSVGLRSVVLGDSQVHAQVTGGLAEARGAGDQQSPFAILGRRLRALLQTVRSTTELQQGNISLERIGCERIVAELGAKAGVVAVVGLGRTGKLIADILTRETRHELMVTNRTAARVAASRFPGTNVFAWDDLSFVSRVDAIALCLANNPETEEYARKLAAQLDPGQSLRPLFLDMSSPSLTRAFPTDTAANLVRIDQLSEDAATNLSTRKQAVNKAKQIIGEWATGVERQLRLADAPGRARAGTAVREPATAAHLATARGTMLNLIRGRLTQEGFLEIQTPCLVPYAAPDDSGVDFRVSGPASDAVLRRSSPMYQQIAVLDGLHRVYEIGPQWHHHASPSPRDLLESQVLGVETRDPADLAELYRLALELVALVASELRGTDLPALDDVPVLCYEEATELLHEVCRPVPYGAGLGVDREYFLGDVVRDRYGSEVFVVHGFPLQRHDFHLARDSPTGRTESFAVVLGGWEVASGGLRETNAEEIRKRMVLANLRLGELDFYLNRFDSAPAHGGFALALDRLLARVLGRPTVHHVTPFALE